MIRLSRADQLALGYATVTAGAVGGFGFSIATLAVPTAAFVALLTDGIARPSSGVLYPTITHGPRNSKRVALSFDDGPDPDVTPAVLDALAAAGARATFFVIGQKLAAQAALGRRIADEGHELGNHSWRHSRWQNFYGTRALHDEIQRCNAAIADITGTDRKPLYRAPIGLKSPPLARAAARAGIKICAWSLHARDTRDMPAARVASRVLDRVRPGDIILMHDGHDLPGRTRPACAPAVTLILEGLRGKGLESVPISELLT